MKYLLLGFLFFTSSLHAQVRIGKSTRKWVDIFFTNKDSVNQYYFDPLFSVDYKDSKSVRIRFERIKQQDDTLFLIMNDTTITNGFDINNEDDRRKSKNKNWVLTLLPNHVYGLKLFYVKPMKYRWIKIIYSFSKNEHELQTQYQDFRR